MYQCELQILGVVAVVCISKYIMCNQDLTITLDSVYCMRQCIYTRIQEQKPVTKQTWSMKDHIMWSQIILLSMALH